MPGRREALNKLPIRDQISILSEQLRPYPWKIAVDGPAAAGKGTLVTGLVGALNVDQCPTGDMYRASTYYLTEILGLDPSELDDEKLASYLTDFSIFFEIFDDGKKHLVIRSESRGIKEDVTDKLQDPAIGKRISAIAKRDPVRDVLDKQQVEMLDKGRTVLEGRDMWQIAATDANLLIYLYARDEVLVERETRRQAERGITLSQEEAETIVTKRNHDDNARDRGKLLTADEARSANVYDLIIDTSDLTPDEILCQVLQKLAKKKR